jgi:hypothetical protein
MKSEFAILRNKKVIPVEYDKWADWLKKAQMAFDEYKLVARTSMSNGVSISTVFLGINHGILGSDIWFETMVFGGEHDGCQYRYETWDEAVMGHDRAVALCSKEDSR